MSEVFPMRRNGKWWPVHGCFPGILFCIAFCAAPAIAQQQQASSEKQKPSAPWETAPIINVPPGVPPAPPAPAAPPATSAPPSPSTPLSQPAPPARAVPQTVLLPSGTVVNVVLETPLSTRIAKPNQKVTFRTTSPINLPEGLEIPPDTAIGGTVVEAKKPGGFGQAGSIRVKIDHVELSQNARVPLVARLQSAETDRRGSIRADNARGTDVVQLVQYTLTGTLLGASIGGGKGAGLGAGVGALAAILIMMSKRGPDVYLEPGMPFVVVLDRPVELPGQDVLDAQESYAAAHAASSAGGAGNGSSADANMTIPPNERPVLKRRPKRP